MGTSWYGAGTQATSTGRKHTGPPPPVKKAIPMRWRPAHAARGMFGRLLGVGPLAMFADSAPVERSPAALTPTPRVRTAREPVIVGAALSVFPPWRHVRQLMCRPQRGRDTERATLDWQGAGPDEAPGHGPAHRRKTKLWSERMVTAAAVASQRPVGTPPSACRPKEWYSAVNGFPAAVAAQRACTCLNGTATPSSRPVRRPQRRTW